MTTAVEVHTIAGRVTGASGVVTFCTCGHGFFAVAAASYDAAQEEADARWADHAGVGR